MIVYLSYILWASGETKLNRFIMENCKISAAIVCRNEERNIKRALDSLGWVDEIVVLDSGSSDRTVEICHTAGARVEQVEWHGYVETKNAALKIVRGEWVLSLDADEEVSPELRNEINGIISGPGAKIGYRIPRKNHYWGRWIKHCGWYPDLQLRLWQRGRGVWTGGSVHESVKVEGSVGRTKAALNHFSYDSISAHLHRLNEYSALIAQDRYEAGKRTGLLALLFSAPWQFFKLYFLRLGFLDGLPGLIVSGLGSYYAFLKKAKLWELRRSDRKSSAGELK